MLSSFDQMQLICPHQKPIYVSDVKVGWSALCCAQPSKEHGLFKRAYFWIMLTQLFGRKHYFIQVDNTYHTATSIHIKTTKNQSELEVTLLQKDIFSSHLLHYFFSKFLNKKTNRIKKIYGKNIIISLYRNPSNDFYRKHNAFFSNFNLNEAICDSIRALELPLEINIIAS